MSVEKITMRMSQYIAPNARLAMQPLRLREDRSQLPQYHDIFVIASCVSDGSLGKSSMSLVARLRSENVKR